MKKIISIFLLCLFFALPMIEAQEDVFNHPITAQTMNAFNAACAKLAETPIIKGNFSQEKFLSRFGRSLVSSGNFIISAEHGMVWETLKPFPSTMILGKDFMLQSRPDGQMSVMSAQGNETFTQMASVLSAVFSGQSQGLIENFEVFFFGTVSNWNIGLLPKDKMIASFAAKITMNIVVSNGNSAIRSIKIFEQSGDIITYTLSNHNYPARLSEHERSLFQVP